MRRLLQIVLLLTLGAWCAPASAQTITYVAAGSIQGTTTTTDATAALPAGTVTNDILIVTCFVRNTGDTMDVSGYSNSFNGVTAQVDTASGSWSWWWKRHDGSEGTATCNKSASADSSAQQHAFRGAKTTGDPWNAVGTPEADVAGNNYTVTGITSAVANSMIIALTGYQDDDEANLTVSGTDPSAYTEVYTEVTTSTSDSAIGVSYAIRATAGATGTVTVDFGSVDPDTDPHGSILLALTTCDTICFVEAGNGFEAASDTSFTASLTFASTNGAVCGLRQGTNNSATVTVTDDGGNTWAQTSSSYTFWDTSTEGAMFYTVGGAAATTITITFSGGVANKAAVCFEVFGMATASPEDSSVNSNDATTGTSLTSGSLTTTNADDILIYMVYANGATAGWAAGTNYILPTNGTDSSGRISMTYQHVAATQSGVTTSISWTTSLARASVFAGYKKASAGAAPACHRTLLGVGC